ncbi:MAG: hypothetical protein CUN51_07405 [Candidatus Thermofonsia Clade 1 bacterium]|uniref:Uncharacterized protein n=1 Tax=Candidatus Thermofonsia Clade 1 bacterium TaxID=2364210 RepID=A0A2M8NZB5_9CHLR|nr:MAG: hypothetical protein CUN51_07405 [Candidatus Thermofonsia Clade 1 bacterium]
MSSALFFAALGIVNLPRLLLPNLSAMHKCNTPKGALFAALLVGRAAIARSNLKGAITALLTQHNFVLE